MWYPGVIGKKDGEPGRGGKSKRIQIVRSINGLITEYKKKITWLNLPSEGKKKLKGPVGLWGR